MTPNQLRAMKTTDQDSNPAINDRGTDGPRFPRFNAAIAEARRYGLLPHLTRVEQLPSDLPARGDKGRSLFSLGLLAVGTTALSGVGLVALYATPFEATRPEGVPRPVSMSPPASAEAGTDELDEAQRPRRSRPQPSDTIALVTKETSDGLEKTTLDPAAFVFAMPPAVDLRPENQVPAGDREPQSPVHHAKSRALVPSAGAGVDDPKGSAPGPTPLQPSRPTTPVDPTSFPASLETEVIVPASFTRMASPSIPLPPEDDPWASLGDRGPQSAAYRAKSPTPAASVDKARIAAAPKASTTRTTAPTPQGYRIQLAAVSTQSTAQNMWTDLVAEHGGVLEALAPMIERNNDLLLLRAGPFASLEEAHSACTRLRDEGADCVLPSR